MRNLTLNLLAAALLIFGATSASAFGISISARNGGDVSDPTNLVSSLDVSDVVTVDVFFTYTGAVAIWGISIVSTDAAALQYDGPASAALPIHPGATNGFGGATGAQPSYIFYQGGRPPRYLTPVNSPYHFEFNGTPDLAGSQQIQVDYLINGNVAIDSTADTGTDYAGTLVFHVVAPFDEAEIRVIFTTASNIQVSSIAVPSSDVSLGAPITLTGVVPEPTTAMLIGLGIVGLGLAGRRRV